MAVHFLGRLCIQAIAGESTEAATGQHDDELTRPARARWDRKSDDAARRSASTSSSLAWIRRNSQPREQIGAKGLAIGPPPVTPVRRAERESTEAISKVGRGLGAVGAIIVCRFGRPLGARAARLRRSSFAVGCSAMLLSRRAFDRLCRARDLLGGDGDALSVRAVAKSLDISPFHFIRQFEALFGETPHQFRLRARLERAQRLLASSDLSVTAVCMEVGFSSLGSFSETFSRRVGAAPSVYRRQARTLVQVPERLAVGEEPGCLRLLAFLPAAAFSSVSAGAGRNPAHRNFGEATPRTAS